MRPELVCEVRHAGWTKQGILRHPAFAGLRDDIAPRDCRREVLVPVDSVLSIADANESAAAPVNAPAAADGGDAQADSWSG